MGLDICQWISNSFLEVVVVVEFIKMREGMERGKIVDIK